jgi:hypothetical protein
MAKKTITEETPKTDEQVIQTTEEVQAVTTETPTEETPKTEDKQPTNEEKREADPHILAILKKFPTYESLYIDTHGGTYTPNTPAAIRGKATLYKNPYFDELKKR